MTIETFQGFIWEGVDGKHSCSGVVTTSCAVI